jgi:pyridoxamine 5'-phosphate oxidase
MTRITVMHKAPNGLAPTTMSLDPSIPALDISRLRVEYRLKTLSESDVATDPLAQLMAWLQDAIVARVNEPNAMTLATATPDGSPSARVVLLKGIDGEGLIFFTNYDSAKGKQLKENPRAAVCFFWPELERQVRVEGTVWLTSDQESEEYFNSRPPESRIGSAASPQSQVISSRRVLEERQAQLLEKYPSGNVPRPPHWGGYRLRPNRLEFWQGGAGRLHDRIEYMLGHGGWTIRRLAP